MSRDVQCGFLPLVDSAPLIIAQELEFAAEEGLNLKLVRQPSWSALRDMLALGHIQFAHMLSPMPIAMSLGLGGMPARIDALMVMSVNGTVIGVSGDLADAMQATGWTNRFRDPIATAKAVFEARSDRIRIGVPFPFSMHRLLLEYWLTRDLDFSPDRIEVVTVPPPQMANAVRDGELDMFCVGEPWGSVAVQQSGASLILPGAAIWQFAPEKILGVRHDWAEENTSTCLAMIRGIYRAASWLDKKNNRPLAAEILARSHHLDLPDHAINPALTGSIPVRLGAAPIDTRNLLFFHRRAANFPWRSQAAWIADRLARIHNIDSTTANATARECFRTDFYRNALMPLGVDLPGASGKIEGAMKHETVVASTRGQMILGPDAFLDGAFFDFRL